MSQTIIIVEDDADQRRNYQEAIEAKGFRVQPFAAPKAAMDFAANSRPDLAILDIVLGSEIDGGFDLCRDLLSRYPDLPVIFLTERIDEIDRISGLRLGAWDYQPKPVSLNFLAERVASLLRLVKVRTAPAMASDVKTLGKLRLNEQAMVAEWDGCALDLTLTEFRVLARLIRNPGQAVSYESLMNATTQQCVTNNTINTHLRNLRRKFKALDGNFDVIKNEYGFGYRWVAK